MRLTAIAGMLLMLAGAGTASAQRVDGQGVPYRAWDFNAGIGWVSSDPSAFEFESYYEHGVSSIQSFDLTGQIGHYWNSHLKTEAGILVRPADSASRFTDSTLPDGSRLFAVYGERRRLTQISPSITWQFLDNTFAHPYVSAGVNVNRITIQTTSVYGSVTSPRGVTTPVTPPPLSGPSSTTTVHPFLAAGFKSYFNERVFVRPEAAVTVSHRMASQVALGFGFGVDF